MHFHLRFGSIILRDTHRHFTEDSLKIIQTELPEVLLIKPKVFPDTRGFFYESYRQDRLVQAGITATFVQDNHSRSSRGTLRGLHYQLHHPQAKLCRVVSGEVLRSEEHTSELQSPCNLV